MHRLPARTALLLGTLLLALAALVLWVPGGDGVAHSQVSPPGALPATTAAVAGGLATGAVDASLWDGGEVAAPRVIDLRPRRGPTLKSTRYSFQVDYALPGGRNPVSFGGLSGRTGE